MDLRAAGIRASWHPITSMISFHDVKSEGQPPFDLFPMRLDDQRIDRVSGRPLNSVLLHELAHLDAARTTRFGWMLGRARGASSLFMAAGPAATPADLGGTCPRDAGAAA